MISYFLKRNLKKLQQYVAAGAEFISIGGNEANGRPWGPITSAGTSANTKRN